MQVRRASPMRARGACRPVSVSVPTDTDPGRHAPRTRFGAQPGWARGARPAGGSGRGAAVGRARGGGSRPRGRRRSRRRRALAAVLWHALARAAAVSRFVVLYWWAVGPDDGAPRKGGGARAVPCAPAAGAAGVEGPAGPCSAAARAHGAGRVRAALGGGCREAGEPLGRKGRGWGRACAKSMGHAAWGAGRGRSSSSKSEHVVGQSGGDRCAAGMA
jgi:hypothetical protein